MTAVVRVMKRVANQAAAQTVREYAAPLAWIAGKLASLVRHIPSSSLWDEDPPLDEMTMRAYVLRVMPELPPRHILALYLYYGLEPDSEAITLDEIAVQTGLAIDEVREIREAFFERLRNRFDEREDPVVLDLRRRLASRRP